MVALDKRKLLATLRERGFDALIEGNELKLPCTLANGETVDLKLGLSSESRYHLPEFSFDVAKHPTLSGLPHVGSSGIVCTFDQASNTVHPDRWEEAVAEIARQAIEVLNDGVEGANTEDYGDELQAYWALDASRSAPAVMICDEPELDFGTMVGAYDDLRPGHVFLALSEKAAKEYACKVSGGKGPVDTVFCLYLRLREQLSFPLPRTVAQWRDEIAKSGTDLAGSYDAFALACEKKAFIVVCSIPTARGRVLLSFSNPAPKLMVKGFRPGHVPIEYALVRNDFGGKDVSRRITEDLRQERLFSRGGDGGASDASCLLIGCGSLGSHLARALCDSGYGDLTLVDNDILSVGNIARHACGFESVGLAKAKALKTALERSNPNVACKARDEDANKMLGNPLALDLFDVVFVTAADAPLELHAVRAKDGGDLECPLVLMWLEPYGLAGHVLVLNKPQDVFLNMFDDELSFRDRVVLNPGDFYEREAGCQSTYVPYSGADAQKFIFDFLSRWRAVLSRRKDRNYHFAWLGALSSAEGLGALISGKYRDYDDYSCRLERID